MPVVYLVGFMGCGKTSVGEALAAILGVHFVDLDRLVSERLGAPVVEVFARLGEAVFRREETRALADLGRLAQGVVATGGGTFCFEENRRLILASGGIPVYLEATWPTLLARLPGKQAERPKFGDPEAARALLAAREPCYRLARVVVPVDGLPSPRAAAVAVAQALGRLTGWPG